MWLRNAKHENNTKAWLSGNAFTASLGSKPRAIYWENIIMRSC